MHRTITFRVFCITMLSLVCGLALSGQQAMADSLQEIMDDYWAFQLRENPVLATSVGVHAYDDRLGDGSPEAFERRRAANQAFVSRLEELPTENLSRSHRVNHRLLLQIVRDNARAVDVGYHYLSRMTTFNPWFASVASLPERLSFASRTDYENYIARLKDVPRFVDGGLSFMQAAIDRRITQPGIALAGTESTISSHVVDNPESSVFYAPFLEMPGALDNASKAQLRSAAREAIVEGVVPAYRRLLQFYRDEYLPACRDDVGASDLPNGRELYEFAIRRETTTGFDADQIHQIGLSEVNRIRAEMENAIAGTGFQGSFKEFQQFLRTDPQFYPTSEKSYLAQASYIAKRMDGELPRLFGRLPRTPYTIKPIPAAIAEKTTTAYAQPAAPDGSVAGVFRLNTSKLSERPLYELEALTFHEARPGHLLQITLANELELPEFRRNSYAFTAFVEGWGLYAERLGLEVGFYKDPYANFGRLSYEMWRACRLVVDTGMHAKGWSRDRAIDFMLQHTSLTRHNIEAEVDRYITWPGQALAYKLGELKFRELRAQAERRLGDRFDVRAFHDAVLANGAIPLDILEAEMDLWIDQQAAGDR